MKRSRSLTRRLAVLVALALVTFPALATAQDASAAAGVQCTRTVKAYVVALSEVLWMNRLGAKIPGGMMFALAGDVFPTKADQSNYKNSCRWQTCQAGNVVLREGKRPRPMVLRANEGDCVQITFTNLLASGSTLSPFTRNAGVHIQGLSWVTGPQDDASFAGQNPNSLAAPGSSLTYNLFAEREGPYFLYSTGDTMSVTTGFGDGGQITQGLFGSMNVQPSGYEFKEDWGSEFYRSQVNQQDLCLASKDKKVTGITCTRDPQTLPVLDYQALYPAGHPRAGLPILNMMCSQKLTPKAIAQGVCVDGELVASDLTAVITGPSNDKGQPQAFPDMQVDQRPPSLRPGYSYPDRLQPYREFTIMYHESFAVTQAFQDRFKEFGSLGAAKDNFGINYGMGGLSSMVLSSRFTKGPARNCVDCKFEEFFLSSWAMGDPAMPVNSPTTNCANAPKDCPAPTKASYPDDPSNVYHSYMSDHVKFRILHAGPDLHHLHHQHAHQWLGTPNSPDGDYLDSQSIGPGSSFTLEMVYNGSGNLNQTVGDSIFHCHFYPHFASGMWSLWRVHDVFEAGTILDPKTGVAVTGVANRALPDGEIVAGTANVALVPLATLPMAPAPARVQLQGVCAADPTKNCFGDADCGGGKGSCEHLGSRYCVYQKDPKWGKDVCLSPYQPTDQSWDQVQKAGWYKNPGYPFFVPGVGGTRAPHPPLDFAWACSKSGKICSPYQDQGRSEKDSRAEFVRPFPDEGLCGPADGICEPMDGGLPRSVAAQGSSKDWDAPTTNYDIGKTLLKLAAIKLPEDGTLMEKVAMGTHAKRFHDTQLPDGTTTGVCSDNGAPCTATNLSQCQNPLKATCTSGRINFVLNGLPPQAGAPYADPCINFDRLGGKPPDLLTRAYAAVDLQLDAIQNKAGWHYPQQRMLSLWGDAFAFLDRQKPPEPLFMRVNSYDCMSYVLANLVPNVYELDDFQIRTPTDILGQHIHLVKFDVTSSDGAGNGWNYEDGTFAPNEVTERIHAINDVDKTGGLWVPQPSGSPKREKLKAKYIKFFGPGPGAQPDDARTGAWLGSQATIQRWYDDPLFNNFGFCSTDLNRDCTLDQDYAVKRGWMPTTEACPNQGVCVSSAGYCSNDVSKRCTEFDRRQCAPDAECNPVQDRTIRTVFTHDHFGPSTHQQAGLYAGVVAEPKGSIWRNNETGEILGGYDPATGENFPGRQANANGAVVYDGGPTSWQAVIQTPRKGESFREFLLEFQDSALTYKPFSVGPNPFEGKSVGVCKDSPDEPCGFCSFTGRCSNDRKTLCQIAVAGTNANNGVPAAGCGDCLFGLTDDPDDPNLVACTPQSVLADAKDNPCYTGKGVVANSCNFVTGVPSGAWKSTAIGAPGNIGAEVITFAGATDNFSVNYRNEPLFPRTTDFSSGNPLPGSMGDLSFAYSSLRFCSNDATKVCRVNADCGKGGVCALRPSPRGKLCTNNLALPCTSDSGCSDEGTCQPAGFCSDNYNLCVADNTALCGELGASCLDDPWSFPYRGLTPGVAREDPFTPMLRAYTGDDIQIRTLVGAHINPHNFTLHGMNWIKENSFVDSGWRNSEIMGISEHFELIAQIPPQFASVPTEKAENKPYRRPFADYLYQVGLSGIEQAAGNWGLIRAYDALQKDLYPISHSREPYKPVPVCRPGSRKVSYEVVAISAQQALKTSLLYNKAQQLMDPQAMLFINAKDPSFKCATAGDWSTCSYQGQPQPLVLRASADDCIQVTLYNALPAASTAICSNAQPPQPSSCPLGASCGPNNSGVCGLFPGGKGICSTDRSKLCTPSTFTLDCPPVLCKNGLCTNDPNSKCTDTTSCPLLVCIPAVGNYPAFDGKPSLVNSGITPLGGVSSLQLTTAKSLVSVNVGLRPQLLSFDPRSGDGTNAGFNPIQTAAPGGQVTYTWYAGNVDPNAKSDDDRHIPIEFGASNLLPSDPLNHYLRGLFGGLIVEPKGATWEPAWGGGTEAVVNYTEIPQAGGQKRKFHEFVVFMQDDTNNMKYPNGQFAVTKTNAVNYRSENLMPPAPTFGMPARFCSEADCKAFLSNPGSQQNVSCMLASSPPNQLWCASQGQCAQCPFAPETPTFTACAGEEMRFRLLHGGGTNTNNVFELAGHTFSEGPFMTLPENCTPAPTTQTQLHASQFLGTKNLCGSRPFYMKERKGGLWDVSLNEWKGSKMGHGPGNHFDVLIDSAGGPGRIAGDYFYRSYTADHFNQGIWGLLRVVKEGSSECKPATAAAGGSSDPAPAGGR